MSRAASWLLRRTDLLIPLLILLPILWALLPGGLPNTADGSVHFTRITEIVSSWRDGIWVPRWSLNLGFGRGIPVFIYGPPLSYWLAAAYHILGLPAEAAFKAMLVSALILGATGAYRLGHLLFGVWAGAVATAALVYAPTLLYTLFVQGNSPQLLAWSFVPWAIWAIIQIYRANIQNDRQRAQLGYGLLLTLTVAGTLLSHNVVGLITAESIALLGLILWAATRRHRAFWITAFGGVLGLLLSAWFWSPAVLETGYISIGAIEGTDYHTEFVPLSELLAWMPRLDAGAINPYIPRSLGLPHLLAGLLGIVLLLGGVVTRRTPLAETGDRPALARLFWGTAIFMSLYALFCGFMQTRGSTPIWEIMPFAYVFQFPARWSYFAGVGLAWLAAAAVGMMARRWQPLVACGLILLLMGASVVSLYPDKLAPGTRVMSPYEVVRYEVKSGAVGTTSYGEFNPIWVTEPLVTSPLVEDYMMRRPVDRLAGMLPPGASHRVLDVTAHRQLYQLTLPAPATLSLNLHYFPGWTAQVNGMAVEVRPQEGTGLLTVDLPAGESMLDLQFGPTRLRSIAGLVSSLTWIGVALAFVTTQLYRARSHRRLAPLLDGVPLTHLGQSGALAARAVITVGAVVGAVWVLQVVGANWFQLHSPPDQALAAPVQRRADIGERFRLLGLEPLPTTARAGDSLTVVAYWRALVEMDENYAVMLRLEDVGSRQTLVEVEQSNPSDIPTSGWATGLYLRNELKVLIPSGAPPIQYAISVGFRDQVTGDMLPTEGGTMVELGRLWLLPARTAAPPAGPRVRFGASIELLGASVNDARLTLYWRADKAIAEDYTIFVHLLDEQGQLLGQMDGTPYANRYPLWAWQPGQIIEDRRDLTMTQVDLAQIHSIAVGVYHPVTGERLAAVDANENLLPDNAQIITWREE